MHLSSLFMTCSRNSVEWIMPVIESCPEQKHGSVFSSFCFYTNFGRRWDWDHAPVLAEEKTIKKIFFKWVRRNSQSPSPEKFYESLLRLEEFDGSISYNVIVNLDYEDILANYNVYVDSFSSIADVIKFVEENEVLKY